VTQEGQCASRYEAGDRIGPFEVESACIEHPAVREAAAVASPDERRGHVVKAFIVLAEGHEASDELAEDEPRPLRRPGCLESLRRPLPSGDLSALQRSAS
jgi:acyl-CoA synthetase (AMP-forming)/AMP-acid ligase II